MPRIPTLLRPLSAVALLTGGLCVACTTDSDSTAGATATPETSDGTTTASDADAATTGEPGETGETEPVDGSTGEAEPELGDALERIASPVLDPRQNDSPITGEPTMLGIFDPCAVWDPRDERWRVYFTFADNVAETSGLARAGLAGAVSSDPTGTSFVVNDGLAVEQLGTFDSESVETCDVIVDPFSETRRFLLYYSGNRGVTDSDYVVALATSDDGVRFDALAPELARDGEAGVLFGVEEALGGMAAEGNFVTAPWWRLPRAAFTCGPCAWCRSQSQTEGSATPSVTTGSPGSIWGSSTVSTAASPSSQRCSSTPKTTSSRCTS